MQARKLSTVSCDAPIEQVVEIIKRDGAVVISNFVSGETLKSLAEELEPYLSATPCGVDPYFAGTQTRRVARIIGRSDTAVEVALNPLFLGAARKILQVPAHVWVGRIESRSSLIFNSALPRLFRSVRGKAGNRCTATIPPRSGVTPSTVVRLGCK